MLLIDPAAPDLDEPLAHFREHGWARLGKVADPSILEAMRTRADAICLGEITYPGLFFQKDTETGDYDDLTYGKGWEGPSLNYRKVEKLEKDPIFASWIENPFFERVTRALIPGDIVIYRAVLFNKAKTGGTYLPWHQDGGRFWGIDRDPFVQLWTALDDCSLDAGCVEMLSGTHAAGLATPLGGKVPDAMVAGLEARAEPVPAEAGEVLLIHNHVWHRSGRNTSGHPRRALTVCYMTAETRCLRTRKAPRTFHPVFRALDVRTPSADPGR